MNKKELVVVLMVTFIAIIVWVVGDILHTRAGVKLSPQLQEASESLDPTFDNSTFQLISQLVSSQPVNNANTVLPPTVAPTPAATISAAPISSQSALP